MLSGSVALQHYCVSFVAMCCAVVRLWSWDRGMESGSGRVSLTNLRGRVQDYHHRVRLDCSEHHARNIAVHSEAYLPNNFACSSTN